MTLSLQTKSIDDVFDNARKKLLEIGGARHIAIDAQLHRVEFRMRNATDIVSVAIQTDDVLASNQVAELATLSLQDHEEQRHKAADKFVTFITKCSARHVRWVCPSLKVE